MRKQLWGLICVALLLATTGCMSTSFQTARTNGEGNFQFAVEPGVTACAGCGFGFDTDGNATDSFWLPSFAFSGRYGISDRVDIGARFGSVYGYELQTKFMLTDPASPEIAMSLAPSFTVWGGGAAGAGALLIDTKLPFLIGIPVGDSEFVVAPRVRPMIIGGGGGGGGGVAFLLSAGGQIGYAARVGEKFWIMPEFGAEYYLLAGAAGDGGSGAEASPFQGLFWSAGVAFMFGGRPASSAAPPSAAPPAAPVQ